MTKRQIGVVKGIRCGLEKWNNESPSLSGCGVTEMAGLESPELAHRTPCARAAGGGYAWSHIAGLAKTNPLKVVVMLKRLLGHTPVNASAGLDIVRVGVALIILMHPLHGFYHSQDIAGFGHFLGSLGYPLGVPLAWTVLLLQTACSLALIVNRWVIPACMGHSVVVCFGIWHVHAPNGWFVVGGGEGGMEWGFILLACLLGVLRGHWPRAARAA